jgi:UDP-N-acetylglucosamine transferase subunit ALG13
VILVTLGTHPQPMDRLVRELDRLLESGALTDDVLIQSARFVERPRHARAVDVLPYPELLGLIRAADVVITHGGTGNLATIRAQGRVPVVVPRSAAHGEHVDDHQREYTARLRSQPGYVVVDDIDDLAGAIDSARSMRTQPVVPDVSRAVDFLESIAACD